MSEASAAEKLLAWIEFDRINRPELQDEDEVGISYTKKAPLTRADLVAVLDELNDLRGDPADLSSFVPYRAVHNLVAELHADERPVLADAVDLLARQNKARGEAIHDVCGRSERLQDQLVHATEFRFRPDFGDLNDQFSDDPEFTYSITVTWRGDDRWAICIDSHRCRSKGKQGWVYEMRSSDRTEEFLADTRFGLDEAVALMPGILREVEAEMIPRLTAQVAARTERADV